MRPGLTTIHEIAQGIPPGMFALMVAIPTVMATAAVFLGWKARQGALRQRVPGARRGPGEDALAAGVTVAVVPGAFALMMLWARLG